MGKCGFVELFAKQLDFDFISKNEKSRWRKTVFILGYKKELIRLSCSKWIYFIEYNFFKKYSWTLKKEKVRQEQEAINQAEAERILREEIIKNNTEIVSAHKAAQNAFHESHAGDHLMKITEIMFQNTESQLSFY